MAQHTQVDRDLVVFENAARPRPVQGLKGLTADNTFRTAGAKEYPPPLAAGMALAILTSIKHRWQCFGPRFCHTLTCEERQWLREVMVVSAAVTRNCWLPDYQAD